MNKHEIFFFCYASFAAFGIVAPVVATFWFMAKLDRDEKRHNEEIRKIMNGERRGKNG